MAGWQVGRSIGVLLLSCAWLGAGCQNVNTSFGDGRQAQLEQRAMALLIRAAQSDDGLVRANAIEALVKLAPQDNLSLFREAVTSAAPLVRFAGCVALGQSRDRASLRAMQRLTDADPDARVRLAAAFAASRCGDTSSGRVLATTLSDHPGEKLRADAAYLIGELGEPKALKRLKLAAAREDSGYVTVQIESAMAKLGDRESVDKLVQYALKSDAVTVLLALQSLVELAEPTTRKTLEYRLHSEADYLQTRARRRRGLRSSGEVAHLQSGRRQRDHAGPLECCPGTRGHRTGPGPAGFGAAGRDRRRPPHPGGRVLRNPGDWKAGIRA
jgi:HEAT repeat protein